MQVLVDCMFCDCMLEWTQPFGKLGLSELTYFLIVGTVLNDGIVQTSRSVLEITRKIVITCYVKLSGQYLIT